MNVALGGTGRERSLCILMNPGSGKRRGRDAAAEIREACEGLPLRLTLRMLDKSRSIGDQTREASEQGFDIIVAAGGDGTICGVAAALTGTEQPMGVLPLGTFNYFARSMNIPLTIGEALQTLATEKARSLAVGEVNGRIFLNNASLGAYPAILKTREEVYDRWGRSRLAAYWSVFLALIGQNHCMRLNIAIGDEVRVLRSPLVFVMLNRFQLEKLGLKGRDIIDSGKFAVFVAPDRGRWGMIRQAIGLAAGTLEASRDFDLRAASEIEISTGRARSRVARDGEREMMASPYRFRLLPDALTVVTPPPAD